MGQELLDHPRGVLAPGSAGADGRRVPLAGLSADRGSVGRAQGLRTHVGSASPSRRTRPRPTALTSRERCACRKYHPCGSGGMFVLVEDACPGRKRCHRLRAGTLGCGMVLVEQSSKALCARDPVPSGGQWDRSRVVVGRVEPNISTLVAAAGVAMIDVRVEHMAEVTAAGVRGADAMGSCRCHWTLDPGVEGRSRHAGAGAKQEWTISPWLRELT
jgi:hypothetical protein